jgi:spermidine synthase
MVGGIYAANTGGAIVGALAFSLVLIPWIGTLGCEQRPDCALGRQCGLRARPVVRQSKGLMATMALAGALAVAGWLSANVSDVPGMLIAYGRRMVISSGSSKMLYTGEGINSSIAITQWNDGAVQFHVSGKVEASTEPYDMRLQRMLGHMPALFLGANRNPCSSSASAPGSRPVQFRAYPGIQRIVICEMEPLIPPTATQYFGKENYNVMHDPRVQIVYDDARHFVLTTNEKFDIITSDPIHPWVKGSATLYSKEYFELVKQHLNPGGIVTQWVPLYESDDRHRKERSGHLLRRLPQRLGLGQRQQRRRLRHGAAGPGGTPEDRRRRHPAAPGEPGDAPVAQSLRDVGFNSVLDLLATYAGQRRT